VGEIRQIVARTWKEHIGVPQEWSTEQTEEFFTEEATRMADRISRMQAEQQLVVIRQWRHAHNGDQPDYLTQVELTLFDELGDLPTDPAIIDPAGRALPSATRSTASLTETGDAVAVPAPKQDTATASSAVGLPAGHHER